MFYLLGFGQPIQLIRPPTQPIFSNGEAKKDDVPIPRKELLYSVVARNITIILNILIPLRFENKRAHLL
jgi:hypothetical protein